MRRTVSSIMTKVYYLYGVCTGSVRERSSQSQSTRSQSEGDNNNDEHVIVGHANDNDDPNAISYDFRSPSFIEVTSESNDEDGHVHIGSFTSSPSNNINRSNKSKNGNGSMKNKPKPMAGSTTFRLDRTEANANTNANSNTMTITNRNTNGIHTRADDHDHKEQIHKINKVAWKSLPSSSLLIRGKNYTKDKIKIPSSQSLYELVDVDAVYSDIGYLNISEKYDLSNLMERKQQWQQLQEQLGKANNDDGRNNKNALKRNLMKRNFNNLDNSNVNINNNNNDRDTTCTTNTKTFRSPRFLIISFLLPTSTPKIGKATNNEKGYIVTGYYKLRNETEDILNIITNPLYQHDEHIKQLQLDQLFVTNTQQAYNQKQTVNAVKLWEKWCTTAPHDPEMQKRLKFIPNGENLQQLGVPSWITKYNCKPMLIKRPGITNFVFHNAALDKMEIDINMHPLPFVFKQAMSHLNQRYFQDLRMSFGFLIEGRGEDELPEVLLGNPIHLAYVKNENVMKARHVFG